MSTQPFTSTPTVSIEPITFGPANRRLFGIVHPPAAVDFARAKVVLCNAFGQEAIRAQRTMWVLAERLARAGHAVLRFDYFGTGDSMGDDVDADLDGWADDVGAADRELRARCGEGKTVWIAMRLGGAVALRAAPRAPATLGRLVLWDPVLDGRRYLEHLRERHVASLERALSIAPTPPPSAVAMDPGSFRDEAIGFALPSRFREQIATLQPTIEHWPARPASIVVVSDPDDADGRDLRAARDGFVGRVQVIDVQHGIDWAGGSSALVPGQALAQLVQHAAIPGD